MLIVDTYNVLHVQGVLPPRLAGLGVPGLIRLLSASRYARRRITLVCDGGPAPATSGVRMDGVAVLYAGAGLEADDLIETLIERYHRGNPLEVVSSDRRLRKAARRRNARSIPSETFLEHLVADEIRPNGRAAAPTARLREQVPLDAYSVREWCREFGLPTPAARHDVRPARTPVSELRADAGRPAPSTDPDHRRARAKRNRGLRHPPASPASIGESLGISLPTAAPDNPPPRPAPPTPPADAAPKPLPAASEGEAGPPPAPEPIDPLLRQALEEWRERLTLDDLDMRRWAPDARPL